MKSTDVNSSFWEWMGKKGYGFISRQGNYKLFSKFHSCSINVQNLSGTEQMLIGYMIEYLISKKSDIMLNICNAIDIEEIYKALEDSIKEY